MPCAPVVLLSANPITAYDCYRSWQLDASRTRQIPRTRVDDPAIIQAPLYFRRVYILLIRADQAIIA